MARREPKQESLQLGQRQQHQLGPRQQRQLGSWQQWSSGQQAPAHVVWYEHPPDENRAWCVSALSDSDIYR